MDIFGWLLLAAGGFVAGIVNAVAGGSSFLTFPLLLAAGLHPLVANMTNFVALTPGNIMAMVAYRRELARVGRGLARARHPVGHRRRSSGPNCSCGRARCALPAWCRG